MVNISANLASKISQAAELIKAASSTVVLTGAGVSTRSGIPDFRTPGSGLWEKHNPTEVASLSSFRYNPEKFFDWMRPVARLIYDANPNPAHESLSKLESFGFIFAIITQNIDGLHQRAGSKCVIEVHGGLEHSTCIGCFSSVETGEYIGEYLDHGTIPRCPDCNNILKPNIILFEEQLPSIVWNKAIRLVAKCDLMIVAGTSLDVMPVASLPTRAKSNGAGVIVINNTPTFIDRDADTVISADVADIFPLVSKEVLGE